MGAAKHATCSFEEFVQLVSRSGERMPDDLLVGL